MADYIIDATTAYTVQHPNGLLIGKKHIVESFSDSYIIIHFKHVRVFFYILASFFGQSR